MVAYSFRPRFIDPILSGRKRQTIRAHRKRHARPGEEVQLYTGMRTKRCELIGRATCIDVQPIEIDFDKHWDRDTVEIGGRVIRGDALIAFAQADGFPGWMDMRLFWHAEHPDAFDPDDYGFGLTFSGVIVTWRDLTARGAR